MVAIANVIAYHFISKNVDSDHARLIASSPRHRRANYHAYITTKVHSAMQCDECRNDETTTNVADVSRPAKTYDR